MQMYGMPYSTSFHQLHGTIPWQTAQPGFGTIGGQQQTMYNPRVGTPLAASTAYNNQLSYPTQPREAQFRGTPPNRMLLPLQTHPQGATTTSHPGYMPGIECYTSQPLHGPAHESMQTRPRTIGLPLETTEGQAVVVPPMGQSNSGVRRELHVSRDTSGGRGDSCTEKGPETARPAPSTLERRGSHTPSSAHTSPGGGTLREQLDSGTEQTPETRNNPLLLSTNSSKSSPPYTLTHRKQLRIEEKSYLREVKRSIAEGRVPQVRLEQNNSGNIVQYKAQFLNALKLAALAIVPNADIDTKKCWHHARNHERSEKTIHNRETTSRRHGSWISATSLQEK